MASVINQTQSPQLYDYEKVFGKVTREFDKHFELPEYTVYKQKNEDCVGYSLAVAGEILFGKAMSPGWSYGKFRSHKKPGLYMEEALKCACDIGMVPLSMFGECAEVPDIIEMVEARPELLLEAAKHKIDGYCKLNYANKEKRDRCIKDAITRYNDKDKKVAVPCTSNKFFWENHAIILTGWDDDNDTWIFQNSEGRSYGTNGRKEMPREKLDYAYAAFKGPIILPFEDVPEDDYRFEAIKNMFFAGIAKGVSDTKFNPNGFITRGDMMVIMDRALSNVYKVIAQNHRIEYEAEG